MNSKSTWLWVALAAGMFGFIYFFSGQLDTPEPKTAPVVPGLDPAAVTAVEVQPAGHLPIRAERTGKTWQLVEPLHYPAQDSSIEQLLSAFQHLTPATRIATAELQGNPGTSEQFGFDPPQASLVLDEAGRLIRIWIGARTSPGDQVFVQVVGLDGYSVVTADLLKLIPRTVNDWRSTTLADLNQFPFDHLEVTNAGKVLQLQRNPTNQLWRMILPNDTRADRQRIQQALSSLQSLRVEHFVSDDPKVDLDAFGLQNPDLSVAFRDGTNLNLLLEFGKSPTNAPDLAYAKRGDRDSVVTVSRSLFEPWLAARSHDFRDFFDPHLLLLTRVPDRIEIHAQDDFTLLRQTNGEWHVTPQDFPADPALVQELVNNLSRMKFTAIVKDVVTDPDLPTYGLASPARKFVFEANDPSGDATNQLLAELDFGINGTNLFARRVGEGFVYALDPVALQRVPAVSWQMRRRQIWNFTEDDVSRIVLDQSGKHREIIHKGTNSWTLAPGSQGIINDLAMGEVAHRLGELSAATWVDRGTNHLERYGFTTNQFTLGLALKTGRTVSVDFGGTAPSGFPYAMTTLDKQPWIFEFPWPLFQYVKTYLMIPDNVP